MKQKYLQTTIYQFDAIKISSFMDNKSSKNKSEFNAKSRILMTFCSYINKHDLWSSTYIKVRNDFAESRGPDETLDVKNLLDTFYNYHVESILDAVKIKKYTVKTKQEKIKEFDLKTLFDDIKKNAKVTNTLPDRVDINSVEHTPYIIHDNPNYIYLPNEKQLLSTLLVQNSQIFINGPAGSGKSELIRQFCFDTGIPYIRFGCNHESDPTDLLYIKTFDGQKVTYVMQGVGKALMIANKIGACVIVLEELNGSNYPTMISLQGLTDHAQQIDSELGILSLNKNCKRLLVGTGNVGYSGTSQLNEALHSRFIHLHKEMPDKQFILDKIWTQKHVPVEFKNRLYDIVTKINDLQKDHHLSDRVVFNTREPLQILDLFGMVPTEVLFKSIVDRWSVEVDREQVQKIINEVIQVE